MSTADGCGCRRRERGERGSLLVAGGEGRLLLSSSDHGGMEGDGDLVKKIPRGQMRFNLGPSVY